ncbi:sugar phosphate isomerase/epimerase family protein [Aureimonas phyllosphaerae]|uniref:Sugar phosphate isomerase/epimerase n=1 Tax=Aureimonas phyllosphaerae TaxID=1166078 RepID=A0A7W6BUS8_9HYPH|nr:TIM barrel protein [Aureimonas phyllosphaerae]MBB3937312.1 sugar phosphate isomerase/epimerase [Aureimonas phyllosphaerae]MBB3961319.1 sugar phosphate isomerase/epimerase [Aureimonas phyllosphaerae]SFF41832.1 Sugar phosphate isomerase/epimerase [Aureimonas phyllosphaerae]
MERSDAGRDTAVNAGRIVSVSAAPYDGYEPAEAFDSLARLGATHVEPAFIVGYTEPFDEAVFTDGRAGAYRRLIEASGLDCFAMSSHIDLGLPDAVDVFSGRMRFARAIGARIVATNAAARAHELAFLRNMESLLRLADELDVAIALENPGDGSDNLLNTAADGLALVRRFGRERLGLNYDAANTASHRPALEDFAADAIEAMPACIHIHVKDLVRDDNGWHFTAIGEGTIGCGRILDACRERPALPVSLELPLRLHRRPDAQPVRRSEPVPLPEIETALARSLTFVRDKLHASI